MLSIELIERIALFVGDADTLRSIKCTSRHFKTYVRVHPIMNFACAGCKSHNRWTMTSRRERCMIEKCMASGLHYMVSYRTMDGRPLCSYGCIFM